MTVSRVVRNKEDVSPVTRERVMQAIERLGYHPNGIARGLVMQRTGTLGLVMPDVANPFFSDMALAVERAAYAEGYNVFLCNTDEDPRRELDMLNSLQEKRVDGIILCSSRMDERELRTLAAHYPAVVLTNRRLEGAGVGTVLVDYQQGGRSAAEHLLNRHHRHIGFLAGPAISRGGRERAEGYRAALQDADLPYHPEWTLDCAPTIEGGYQAARDLLEAFPILTALFCYNDLVAVGALRAATELGRRVPDDVAIVGFDDIPLAALVTPPLTTCHVARYELGIQAARLLLDKLGSDEAEYEEIILETTHVRRQSAP
jgi:LacI family transcriptional regulator